jgi:hypothetical protein
MITVLLKPKVIKTATDFQSADKHFRKEKSPLRLMRGDLNSLKVYIISLQTM